MDMVTQMVWGFLPPCPVHQWAGTVKQIQSYSGVNDDTPVLAVWRHGRIDHITSKMMTDALEGGFAAVGYKKLGIKEARLKVTS